MPDALGNQRQMHLHPATPVARTHSSVLPVKCAGSFIVPKSVPVATFHFEGRGEIKQGSIFWLGRGGLDDWKRGTW